MLIHSSLAVCFFFVVVSGSPIDGNVPLIAKYPYIASIEIDSKHIGGASILSRHFALTYGMTVWGSVDHFALEGGLFSVRTGSDFLKKNGSVHTVCDHKFDLDDNTLMVVLQLADPISFDRLRRPIRLFGADDKVEPGTKVSLSAWANLKSASVDSPQLEIFEGVVRKNCSKGIYKRGVFCIDRPNEISKKVGRGHPVEIGGMLAGIVVFSIGNETRIIHVPTYSNWITNTMKQMAAGSRCPDN